MAEEFVETYVDYTMPIIASIALEVSLSALGGFAINASSHVSVIEKEEIRTD